MDIKEVRAKTGLSEVDFLQKIKPALQRNNSRLSKRILRRLERGGATLDGRMEAIVESIKETFPELAGQAIEQKKLKRLTVISRNHIALGIFLAASTTVLGMYFYFDMKEVVDKSLSIIASVSAVLAFIFVIYKVTN